MVDIPNVCRAGRKIARENGMEARIIYYEADFVRDKLPTGFDLVLDCDVGAYDREETLGKLAAPLRPGGRLVIVDQFAPVPDVAPPAYGHWAFLAAMANPAATQTTVAQVRPRLEKAGFEVLPAWVLPFQNMLRWSGNWIVLEARRREPMSEQAVRPGKLCPRRSTSSIFGKRLRRQRRRPFSRQGPRFLRKRQRFRLAWDPWKETDISTPGARIAPKCSLRDMPPTSPGRMMMTPTAPRLTESPDAFRELVGYVGKVGQGEGYGYQEECSICLELP